jgi:hypothetical protein
MNSNLVEGKKAKLTINHRDRPVSSGRTLRKITSENVRFGRSLFLSTTTTMPVLGR